jgi:hypothetical protein
MSISLHNSVGIEVSQCRFSSPPRVRFLSCSIGVSRHVSIRPRKSSPCLHRDAGVQIIVFRQMISFTLNGDGIGSAQSFAGSQNLGSLHRKSTTVRFNPNITVDSMAEPRQTHSMNSKSFLFHIFPYGRLVAPSRLAEILAVLLHPY